MRDLTLQIEGMSCGHCVGAVSRALAALPGVEVRSLMIGRAEIGYDERAVEPSAIEAAVTGAGYPARAAS